MEKGSEQSYCTLVFHSLRNRGIMNVHCNLNPGAAVGNHCLTHGRYQCCAPASGRCIPCEKSAQLCSCPWNECGAYIGCGSSGFGKRNTSCRGYIRLEVFYAFLIQLKNWQNMNEILIGNISHFGNIDGF